MKNEGAIEHTSIIHHEASKVPVSVDCLSSHESVFPVTVVWETPKNTGKFEKHVESIRRIPHL